MNFIIKGIHAAVEPLRYTPTVATHRTAGTERPSGAGALIRALGHRYRLRRTIRELDSLSDATLKDIGIERGNIPALVEEMLLAESAPQTLRKTSKAHAADYPATGGAAA